MAYIKQINGYIVDVPKATFTRCDGKVFHFDKLNSCNFTPNMEPIDINGGWSMYPLASINAGSSAEVQLTSSEFRADLFEMAHATTAVAETAYDITVTKQFDVGTGLTITLPEDVTDVYIPGMKQGEATAAGVYTITDETVTFHTGDVAVGDTVLVSYTEKFAGTRISADITGASAKGTLQLEYPVYSSGTDCTEASRKGFYYLKVFRVRVSALPGFDSSLTYRLLAA